MFEFIAEKQKGGTGMEMRLLSAALEDEIEAAQSETLELIKTLCRIPAPSHREERRAAFIREWL